MFDLGYEVQIWTGHPIGPGRTPARGGIEKCGEYLAYRFNR